MGEIETIAFHIYQKVLSFQSAVSNLDINKCSGLIRVVDWGLKRAGGLKHLQKEYLIDDQTRQV